MSCAARRSALVVLALAWTGALSARDGEAATAPATPSVFSQELFEVPRHDALIDPARSQAGFSVRMRWFARVDGRFSSFRGQVASLGGDLRRVEVELDAASLDVGGRARMTEWAASDEFFDVAQYPVIVFVSEPFQAGLAVAGGELPGELSLRGTTQRVVFEMLPATCLRPGRDCPIVVEGRVSRADFGMDAHRMAVQDGVDLRFEVLLVGPADSA